jgi:hypothetical protein
MPKNKKEDTAKEKPDVFEWAALNTTARATYPTSKAMQQHRESKESD